MQKPNLFNHIHYLSTRWYLYFLVLITLMVTLSGCGAVTTVDTKIKADGSGHILMKANVSASDLSNLSGGAEALNTLLESKKPAFLTIESHDTSPNGEWSGSFSFEFADNSDLQTKLRILTENPQLVVKYQCEGTELSGKVSYDQGFSNNNAYWKWAQTLIKDAGILSSANYDSIIATTNAKIDFDFLTPETAPYVVQDQSLTSSRKVSVAIPAQEVALQLEWSKAAVNMNWTLNVSDSDLSFMKTFGFAEISDTLQNTVGQDVTVNKESQDGHTILKWSFKGHTLEELNEQGGDFIKFSQVSIQKTDGGSWYYPEYTASVQAELPFFQSELLNPSNSSGTLETVAHGTITSPETADNFDFRTGLTQSLTFQAPNVWAFIITGVLVLIVIVLGVLIWRKKPSVFSFSKGRSQLFGHVHGEAQSTGNEQTAAADGFYSGQAALTEINAVPSFSEERLKDSPWAFLRLLVLRPKLGIAVIAVMAVLSGYLLGGIFSITGSAVLKNSLGDQFSAPGGFSYFATALYSPFYMEASGTGDDLSLIPLVSGSSQGQTKLELSVPLLGLSLLISLTMVFWGAMVERLRLYGGQIRGPRYPILIYGGIYALIAVLLSELLSKHMAIDIPLLGSLTVTGGNGWLALLINSFITASAFGWLGSKLIGKRHILRSSYRAWLDSQSPKMKNFIYGIKTSGIVFIVLSIISFLAISIWNVGDLSGSFGARIILAVAMAPVAAIYALYLLLFGRASLDGSWLKLNSFFDQLSGSAQSSAATSLDFYFSNLSWIVVMGTLLIIVWLIFSAFRNYRFGSPLSYALSFGLGFSSIPIIGSLLTKASIDLNGSPFIDLKISPFWNWFLIFIISTGIAYACSYFRSRTSPKN